MRSWHKPPPEPNAAGMVGETFSIRVSPLKIVESLLSHFALAGIGSLAVATLTPLPTVAAPGITLQGSFDGAINGSGPYAALTAAGNGIYYGTTQNGGANGNGAIFKFDSTTGSITLQDSFDGTNGSYPTAALTAAGNGLYYGTTEYGGTSNNGAIFEFDSANGSITLKGNFDGANGTRPYAALTAAGNGIYYGTTENGGGNGSGGIFEFDPANSANGSITLKGNFNGANGSRPYAALAAAGNGIYYGTTYGGGANFNGGIFAFDSTNGSIGLQDSFDVTNGSDPYGPYAALTAAGNGFFYGTTPNGGANNQGAIFAFDSGVRDPVPGPLPLMGAGAAFGWSRRLRRRIQPVRPVFPMGR